MIQISTGIKSMKFVFISRIDIENWLKKATPKELAKNKTSKTANHKYFKILYIFYSLTFKITKITAKRIKNKTSPHLIKLARISICGNKYGLLFHKSSKVQVAVILFYILGDNFVKLYTNW